MNKLGAAPKGRFIFVPVAILIGLVTALALVEILLRLLWNVPTSGLASVDESEFQTLPGIWHPHQNFVSREKPALPYHVKINSLGYRGDDFALKKPADEFRILMTGDSVTFGVFVDGSDSLPAQVERELRSQCGTSNIRVINAGLPGGTIWGEDEIITKGLVLEPDVVVLTFHENDLYDLKAPLWVGMGENRRLKSSFPMSLAWPLIRHTALWNFLVREQRRWHARGYRPPPPDATADASVQAAYLAEQNELKSHYQRRLHAVRDKVQSGRATFAFAIYPGPNPVKGGRDVEIVAWAAQAGREAGISTTNLLFDLRHGLSYVEEGYLLPRDYHPSPVGYRIAAKALSEGLMALDVMQKPCSGYRSAAR